MTLVDKLPYFVLVLTCLGSAFEILKKKPEGEQPWLRMVSLGFLIVLSVLGMITLHHERVKQSQDAAVAATKAQTAKDDQDSNTARFLSSFKDLSGQLADLKAEVKSEPLQSKIDTLQSKLDANEKAMAPGPKATLTFTFWPFDNVDVSTGLKPTPVTSVILPVDPDGTVHIEFTIVNFTDADAIDGDITLIVCNVCKITKEPEGFTRIEGEPETERTAKFDRLLRMTHASPVKIDVMVPKGATFTVLGTKFRCRTCEFSNEISKGLVTLRPN